ncbi:hypothetical protein [Xanthomonas sp. NCPPB 1128]|uniref:hypothetical protein n=1 Tax=Xanthomonas sp. NCPPB 1128 TaxID=1775876 RepID=UPI00103BB721|nr:hypothetical protein [Xanthomonas sp. NCPPB 1128]
MSANTPGWRAQTHAAFAAFTAPPRPRLEGRRPPSATRAVSSTRCGHVAWVVPSSWSNAMPDSAGVSRFRSLSFERRRRLRRWARLRHGICVTLACVAVALAPSWDARSAPPAPAQTPVPPVANGTPDIRQVLHALRDQNAPEALGKLLP